MFKRDLLFAIHNFSELRSLANNVKIKSLLKFLLIWYVILCTEVHCQFQRLRHVIMIRSCCHVILNSTKVNDVQFIVRSRSMTPVRYTYISL